MSFVTQNCYLAKPNEVERKWYSVDADGMILGRLAARIAVVLMGKHKPTYTPHVDTGDFVVVTNAEKIRVTGTKTEEYKYVHYTYHADGLNVTPYKEMMEKHPERILWWSVRRMLPKNALGRRLLTKLKVYAGPEHPHAAQQCEPLAMKGK